GHIGYLGCAAARRAARISRRRLSRRDRFGSRGITYDIQAGRALLRRKTRAVQHSRERAECRIGALDRGALLAFHRLVLEHDLLPRFVREYAQCGPERLSGNIEWKTLLLRDQSRRKCK